ncbi:tubulin polyglutamylase complex subunit 2 isoform X2 [Phalacrocorax aristotelis]|uniref:tubulin polyglutamylase complex subunit 2 isoform X2 n=1 Tax=Phalacrocorax aristotelis TaxID=126867 RepID=UPI003F4C706C
MGASYHMYLICWRNFISVEKLLRIARGFKELLSNDRWLPDDLECEDRCLIADTPMPLGSMVINSVSNLCRLGGSSMYTLPNAPTLADLEDDTDEEGNGDKPEKPHFDSRSLIFELDPCNGNGKVCLVYKHAKPVVSPDTEIWFLDRALYWHFLTKTFTAYYRLLITHLGLPQWQYAFTSYGVSPQAKQWFNMYKPITINTALLSEEADSFVNKLDPNKVFKSKNKTPVIKKKLPSQPAGSQKSHTSMASSKTSSLGGNSSRK